MLFFQFFRYFGHCAVLCADVCADIDGNLVCLGDALAAQDGCAERAGE